MADEATLQEIPPKVGHAIRLAAGQAIKLVNTFGSQVVDTWALNALDTTEYLSMEHTRRMCFKLWPQEGDSLYSNRRTAMLVLERDTSPGVHDTLFACCDKWLYEWYECPPGHANCHDNFLAAIAELGVESPLVPNPLNLWMNMPVTENLRLAIGMPVSKPEDYVVLRALIDVVVVFSTCPMDVSPINGPDREPKAVHYQIVGV